MRSDFSLKRGTRVKSKMSGRNPPLVKLYNHIERHAGTPNTKTKGTIRLDTTQFVALGLGSDGCR